MAGFRWALAPVLLCVACTEMQDFYPDMRVVSVEGTEVSVGPERGRTDVWHAVPNKPTGSQAFRGDPQVLRLNIAAIEAASGCEVNRDTVEVRVIHTFAAVDC